jgi:hypothetical protein
MKRRDDDRAQDHGSERVVSALRRALQQAVQVNRHGGVGAIDYRQR